MDQMDGLSGAASIIAVIQLSSTVIGLISTISGARNERKRLREEIQACSDLLQELKDDAEDSGERTPLLQNIEALEGPHAPLGRLAAALNVVKTNLE